MKSATGTSDGENMSKKLQPVVGQNETANPGSSDMSASSNVVTGAANIVGEQSIASNDVVRTRAEKAWVDPSTITALDDLPSYQPSASGSPQPAAATGNQTIWVGEATTLDNLIAPSTLGKCSLTFQFGFANLFLKCRSDRRHGYEDCQHFPSANHAVCSAVLV